MVVIEVGGLFWYLFLIYSRMCIPRPEAQPREQTLSVGVVYQARGTNNKGECTQVISPSPDVASSQDTSSSSSKSLLYVTFRHKRSFK